MLKSDAAVYDLFDVVRVPFPFSDSSLKKRRPALVISSHKAFGKSKCVVIAMITTGNRSRFPLDIPIRHWREAGLLKACKLRMKIFTLEQALIEKKLGRLQAKDRRKAAAALRQLIPLLEKDSA